MTTYERLRRLLAQTLEVDEATITPVAPLAVLLSQNRTSGADGPFDLSSDSLDVIELMMAFEADAELFAGMPDVNLKTWKHLLATFTVQELADFIDGR